MTRTSVVAIARAIVAIAWVARVAAAEPDPEERFRAAEAKAIAGDPSALDELEALGAARPISRWSDDAWSEAARLAEKAGDFTRARRDLEQVVAIGTEAGASGPGIDQQLVRRARAELARLASFTGTTGQWSGVAAAHERLAQAIVGTGDPRASIVALDELVRANPGYPRATSARLVIARGLERDGRSDDATSELRDAIAAAVKSDDRTRARLALARLSIRRGELGDAATEIDAVAAALPAERLLIADLRDDLHTAARRAWIRIALWLVLAMVAAAAAVVVRRDAGSWRPVLRALATPPIEVVYLAPISIVIAVVSTTGNPLVGRAVRAIAFAGIVVAWLSGAMFELARRHDKLRVRRVVGQAVVAVVAVAAAVYLVVDHDRMIDLIAETWRSGPAAR